MFKKTEHELTNKEENDKTVKIEEKINGLVQSCLSAHPEGSDKSSFLILLLKDANILSHLMDFTEELAARAETLFETVDVVENYILTKKMGSLWEI